MSKEVSRRSFVKAGAGATALAGVAATGAFSFGNWFDEAHAAEEVEEQTRYMWHSSGCTGHCSLKCTIRDGRMVMVEPNDTPTVTDRVITCARGISEVQGIYGLGRIKSPMKLVGERGSGEFVAISWDEAFDTIETKIKEIQKQYGNDSILYFDKGVTYPWFSKMIGMQYHKLLNIDIGIENGYGQAFTTGSGRFWGTAEIADTKYSTTVISIGTNELETDLAMSWHWFDVKEGGAKTITIDPNYSATASKSDQWIPIQNGTDAALLLGMITIILDNNWYDKNYVMTHTGFPFLINADTGKYLRDITPDPANKVGVDGASNPFYVWDKNSNSPKPYNSANLDVELEGEFESGGNKYITVFSQLKKNQKEYTVSWASKITTVPEDTIIGLAKQYATAGPAFIFNAWGGPDKYGNADICGHAMAILIGLTANIGRPGSGFLNMGYFLYPGVGTGSWPVPKSYPGTVARINRCDFRFIESNIHAVFAPGNPFQQLMADTAKTDEWVKTLDFIVVAEVYHTASVDYADIVLPVCSYFECEEDVRDLTITKDRLMVRQKIIEPLFEAKTDFAIEQELCKRFAGLDGLPANREEMIRFQLANSATPVVKSITLEELIENQCAMTLDWGVKRPVRLLEEQKFATPSGRFEPYYDEFTDYDQALPTFEYPMEAYDDNPLKSKYPLIYINAKNKYRGQSRFFFAEWINSIVEPWLEINPADAKNRSLKTGDLVEIANDRGSFQMKVRINSAVRPGVVKSDVGVAPAKTPKGLVGNVMNPGRVERSKIFRFGPNDTWNDNLVEIKKVGA